MKPVRIIRDSQTLMEARTRLMDALNFRMSSRAPLWKCAFAQLTGMEQDKLRAEYEDLMKQIEHI